MGRQLALGLLGLMLFFSTAVAEDPADAARLWTEQHGDEGVEAVWVEPTVVQAGTQFEGFIRFAPDYPVEDVTYQICEVGDACFAIGVPMEPVGDNTWRFDTADLPKYTNLPRPREYKEGEDIGFSFFVYLPDVQREEGFLPFPDQPKCSAELPYEEWMACEETQYFVTTIAAGEKETPGLGLLPLLPLLGLAARRR